MPRDDKKRKPLLIRLPPALHEELQAWAEQELRSLNSQIEYVLRQAVERRRGKSAGAPPAANE